MISTTSQHLVIFQKHELVFQNFNKGLRLKELAKAGFELKQHTF